VLSLSRACSLGALAAAPGSVKMLAHFLLTVAPLL
jgi:hypothetical protein